MIKFLLDLSAKKGVKTVIICIKDQHLQPTLPMMHGLNM